MIEIKDKTQEIFDDFKGRIRNPLILSALLVWLYLHWEIVLILLDNSMISDEKRTKISGIISARGWWGMVGAPIVFGFLSMCVYFILRSLVQYPRIFLGKRLYSAILGKSDRGEFVYRSELEKVRSKFFKVNEDLFQANERISNYNDEKEDLLSQINSLSMRVNTHEHEIKDLRGNIDFNVKFKNKFETTILWLYSTFLGVQSSNILRERFDKVSPAKLNGRWKQTISPVINQDSGSLIELIFDNGKVFKYVDGQEYCMIEEVEFDQQLSLMKLKMKFGSAPDSSDNYQLIHISNGEYRGFRNKKDFIILKKVIPSTDSLEE